MKLRSSLVYLAILFAVTFACQQQSTPAINTEELSRELDSIMVADQLYRDQMRSVHEEYGWDSPEMKKVWKLQNDIDSSNVIRIIEIIELVDGYPGKSLVGHESSKVAFFVLQHAPDSIQEQYYELIVQAGEANELKKGLVAMYQDRYLMHRGEPQIFGTQVQTEFLTDSLTGEQTEHTYVWPIADTTNIDSVRRWNGLGPLEAYLNNFGVSRWE